MARAIRAKVHQDSSVRLSKVGRPCSRVSAAEMPPLALLLGLARVESIQTRSISAIFVVVVLGFEPRRFQPKLFLERRVADQRRPLLDVSIPRLELVRDGAERVAEPRDAIESTTTARGRRGRRLEEFSISRRLETGDLSPFSEERRPSAVRRRFQD